MTMVEPVHLLLFGSSSVVSHGNGVVKLDEWSVKILVLMYDVISISIFRLPLLMSHDSASLIGGLRQAVDDMLVRVATDPNLLTEHSPHNDALIRAVTARVTSKSTPPSLPPLPPGG